MESSTEPPLLLCLGGSWQWGIELFMQPLLELILSSSYTWVPPLDMSFQTHFFLKKKPHKFQVKLLLKASTSSALPPLPLC